MQIDKIVGPLNHKHKDSDIKDTTGKYVQVTGDTMTGDLNVLTNVNVTGDLVAATKSFLIPHPTKPNKKLHYGSLEGPEHGVYYRGKLENENIIELPEYWTKLVDEESITVNLTPFGKSQKLWVEKIENNKIYVKGSKINCYFTVFATREKIKTEE